MKKFYLILTLAITIMNIDFAHAQTYVMNWGTSFSPAWSAGSTSSRTTTTFGTSGLSATISLAGTESTACSAFAGFTSPQISSGGSPFNTQFGTAAPNLALGIDLASNTGYVELTISFNSQVSNIDFNISDIDKNNATSTTYLDEVVVTGFNGSTAVTHPALSKLNGTAVNSTTDTVLISGNVARANPVSGRGGNTPSGLTNQNGTVRVQFGSTVLTRIVIRYRNSSGAQANPAQQAIGIGNISFSAVSTLPVVFGNFSASVRKNTAVLNWQTSQEFNAEKFVIEKSRDGQNWLSIGEVRASGNSTITRNYEAIDENPFAVNYYRIRQVDFDGNATYTKVVLLSLDISNAITAKVYPNPTSNRASLSVNINSAQAGGIKIYNSNGILMQALDVNLNAGLNTIELPSASSWARGIYLIVVQDKNQNKLGTVRLIKQ
jgi:hypothetical protein